MNTHGLSNRIRTTWESLSTSYWFIPLCMMLFSALLCGACLFLLQRTTLPDWLLTFIPLVTQEGAQQVLGTLASSIITVTSIAFSMTIVALTLASSQFGPRLIRTFMVDRGTQVVLGMLVSSFLFCLLALHYISAVQENQDAMSLLTALSVVLGVLNIGVIIYFIHHVAASIQADQVIYRCFRELCGDIETLLPAPSENSSLKPVAPALLKDGPFRHTLTADREGYVQTIDYEALATLRNDIVAGVEVIVRGGDHVFPRAPILVVHSHTEVNTSLLRALSASVIVGKNRTPIQDPEFALGQLVEIALRALSPGINDPATALTCLDRLTSACILMSERTFPAPSVINRDTNCWIKRRAFTMEGVIDRAFDQIRQDGKSHVAIALHILHCLYVLKQQLDPNYAALLARHANATYALAMTESVVEKDNAALDAALSRLV
ncbi:DUF2254 domain-containing protein [Alteromonas sp. ASW11-19]|uniref:DUF2254 domain-containing protein n=1 Tax=Alteromonas salexigens TaxID=2982530 RepID=A0ABT2VM31_9ALTE|nr:DUF2254 domain-containing protein [Alteromonas salexigens]MCU7554314.1 DUF2254 domain-containing protein [Alteromonas salexigens]